MKKFRLYISYTIIAILFVSISACKKQTYENRIEGIWVVQYYYKNGNDKTSDYYSEFESYRLKFDEDGDYTETYDYYGVSPTTKVGTWEMPSTSQLAMTDSQSNRSTYDIVEIKKDKIDIKLDNEEFVLVPE